LKRRIAILNDSPDTLEGSFATLELRKEPAHCIGHRSLVAEDRSAGGVRDRTGRDNQGSALGPDGTLRGPRNVVLDDRATTVPFTAVLSGPQRTTTDKAKAASTGVVPCLHW
jgi:hypothetical protein